MPKIEAVFDCNIYLQAAARSESVAAACLRLAKNVRKASDEVADLTRQIVAD